MMQRSITELARYVPKGTIQQPKASVSRQIKSKPLKSLHLILRKYSQQPIGSKLIPTVNKLQEIFSMTGTELDLPQIVVVGAQSSGKSSVLENLVGRDFLPRGSGIVTRRPLILQLTQIDENKDEYGEFMHKPNTKFYQFDQIRSEIEAETDKVAGRNLGVVDRPILLKIYSPHVINLTLVDLPGIARNPVGDQPMDIEARIITMIRKYAEKPNAIILAVHSANQDLATSDAIKLATQVDPAHSRTVGVLTKLDLMDKGTDAMNVLMGREMPLHHGWVPVLSRSQQDILRHKTIAAALRDEEIWFKEHPVYSQLADRTGTSFLAHKCNKLLTEHIRKTLPDLKAVISTKIKACKAELAVYGEAVPKDSAAAGPHLLSLFGAFSNAFKDVMEGTSSEIQTKDLNGGARIRYILNENFTSRLEEVTPLTGLTTNDIRMAIRNSSGTKSTLFVPDQAFEQLVKRQIALFREPALKTAEVVCLEMMDILATLPCNELVRYKRLREKITEASTKALKARLKEANSLIDTMLKLEVGFINTNHPDFIGLGALQADESRDRHINQAISQSQSSSSSSSSGGLFSFLFGGKKESTPAASTSTNTTTVERVGRSGVILKLDDKQMSQQERNQVRTVVSLLDSYLKISQKSFQDTVIKVIMCKLVNETRESVLKDITSALYDQKLFAELLREGEDIEAKRNAAKENLERLRAAKKVIQAADEGLWEDY